MGPVFLLSHSRFFLFSLAASAARQQASALSVHPAYYHLCSYLFTFKSSCLSSYEVSLFFTQLFCEFSAAFSIRHGLDVTTEFFVAINFISRSLFQQTICKCGQVERVFITRFSSRSLMLQVVSNNCSLSFFIF